ncbi:MAG: glycosyltransferase, partial [Hyphococcus sp.]
MARFNHTILQVVPALGSGGAERTTLEIASAVVQNGGRALVASSGGRLAADIEMAGGEVVLMPVHSKNPFTIWLNGGRLADLVRRETVDLIHARSRAPAWSALSAARKTGKPFVTTYHGAYRNSGPLKRYYNSSMLRADCVIANSRYTGRALTQLGGLATDRLRVIPRGVDLDLFDPAKVSAARLDALADSWSVPVRNDKFRVLLPARLTAWKGHETAIDALAKLKASPGTGNARDLTL